MNQIASRPLGQLHMPHQLQGKGVPVEDRQWECVKLSVDGEKEGMSGKRDSVVAQNMTHEERLLLAAKAFIRRQESFAAFKQKGGGAAIQAAIQQKGGSRAGGGGGGAGSPRSQADEKAAVTGLRYSVNILSPDNTCQQRHSRPVALSKPLGPDSNQSATDFASPVSLSRINAAVFFRELCQAVPLGNRTSSNLEMTYSQMIEGLSTRSDISEQLGLPTRTAQEHHARRLFKVGFSPAPISDVVGSDEFVDYFAYGGKVVDGSRNGNGKSNNGFNVPKLWTVGRTPRDFADGDLIVQHPQQEQVMLQQQSHPQLQSNSTTAVQHLEIRLEAERRDKEVRVKIEKERKKKEEEMQLEEARKERVEKKREAEIQRLVEEERNRLLEEESRRQVEFERRKRQNEELEAERREKEEKIEKERRKKEEELQLEEARKKRARESERQRLVEEQQNQLRFLEEESRRRVEKQNEEVLELDSMLRADSASSKSSHGLPASPTECSHTSLPPSRPPPPLPLLEDARGRRAEDAPPSPPPPSPRRRPPPPNPPPPAQHVEALRKNQEALAEFERLCDVKRDQDLCIYLILETLFSETVGREQEFMKGIAADIVAAVGCNPDKVRVKALHIGSVVAEAVLSQGLYSDGRQPMDAVRQLFTQMHDSSSILRSGAYTHSAAGLRLKPQQPSVRLANKDKGYHRCSAEESGNVSIESEEGSSIRSNENCTPCMSACSITSAPSDNNDGAGADPAPTTSSYVLDRFVYAAVHESLEELMRDCVWEKSEFNGATGGGMEEVKDILPQSLPSSTPSEMHEGRGAHNVGAVHREEDDMEVKGERLKIKQHVQIEMRLFDGDQLFDGKLRTGKEILKELEHSQSFHTPLAQLVEGQIAQTGPDSYDPHTGPDSYDRGLSTQSEGQIAQTGPDSYNPDAQQFDSNDPAAQQEVSEELLLLALIESGAMDGDEKKVERTKEVIVEDLEVLEVRRAENVKIENYSAFRLASSAGLETAILNESKSILGERYDIAATCVAFQRQPTSSRNIICSHSPQTSHRKKPVNERAVSIILVGGSDHTPSPTMNPMQPFWQRVKIEESVPSASESTYLLGPAECIPSESKTRLYTPVPYSPTMDYLLERTMCERRPPPMVNLPFGRKASAPNVLQTAQTCPDNGFGRKKERKASDPNVLQNAHTSQLIDVKLENRSNMPCLEIQSNAPNVLELGDAPAASAKEDVAFEQQESCVIDGNVQSCIDEEHQKSNWEFVEKEVDSTNASTCLERQSRVPNVLELGDAPAASAEEGAASEQLESSANASTIDFPDLLPIPPSRKRQEDVECCLHDKRMWSAVCTCGEQSSPPPLKNEGDLEEDLPSPQNQQGKNRDRVEDSSETKTIHNLINGYDEGMQELEEKSRVEEDMGRVEDRRKDEWKTEQEVLRKNQEAGAVNWWLSDHSERSRSVYGKEERTETPKSSVSSFPTRPQHYPIPPTPQTGNRFAEWLPDFMELCSPVRETKMVQEVGGETGLNHPWGVHGVNEPPPMNEKGNADILLEPFRACLPVRETKVVEGDNFQWDSWEEMCLLSNGKVFKPKMVGKEEVGAETGLNHPWGVHSSSVHVMGVNELPPMNEQGNADILLETFLVVPKGAFAHPTDIKSDTDIWSRQPFRPLPTVTPTPPRTAAYGGATEVTRTEEEVARWRKESLTHAKEHFQRGVRESKRDDREASTNPSDTERQGQFSIYHRRTQQANDPGSLSYTPANGIPTSPSPSAVPWSPGSFLDMLSATTPSLDEFKDDDCIEI